MRIEHAFYWLPCFILWAASCTTEKPAVTKTPVDYVNPYMGSISHLLVPAYPTVHLPNSLLRIYPQREDFTSVRMKGLPVAMTGHRGQPAFSLNIVQPETGDRIPHEMWYEYDNERITPYSYHTRLLNEGIEADFAPSRQSGIYRLSFTEQTGPCLFVHAADGKLTVENNRITGYRLIENSPAKFYIYLEVQEAPLATGVIEKGRFAEHRKEAEGKHAAAGMTFGKGTTRISLRYGISLISTEQAERNLRREINHYDVEKVAEKGKEIWNGKLGKIEVAGADENTRSVFYTSLYRTYERMVCISEDHRYWSPSDSSVHHDNGIPFYTDDWVWDTYRACHPLRVLIEPAMETDMIDSYLRMAEQSAEGWMPTFPEITGDSHRMNSNHGVAAVLDSYRKGLKEFDLKKAYQACKKAVTEKTLAPWSAARAGELDRFYRTYGYIPALPPGRKETVPEVHPFEKRQPVAVTLGTVYDEWCLAQIAHELSRNDEYAYFIERARNYRSLFNPATRFFHPKDEHGHFIAPFDYTLSGGTGAREAYGENNGWIYRWDTPHDIAGLIRLMGGDQAFIAALDSLFATPLGVRKYAFYARMPDQTGNVGQFSMANEPALHIPYLYTYAGQPWKTQKSIRSLVNEWFRNDLMGIPGDEDGGGLSAFVVFSALGFYPVTPGLPMYVIGSPMFDRAVIHLENGKTFRVVAENNSETCKYVQQATLNGKTWNRSWFSHDELMQGGELILVMGDKPNPAWASSPESRPPSFVMQLPKK